MRSIDYLELGATLYIPATHDKLEEVILHNCYPTLRSVVICLEDSISDEEFHHALLNVAELLQLISQKHPQLFIFIRPRNIENLQELLTFANIGMMDGFVLPKVTTTNLLTYLELFRQTKFYLMPTLETIDVFDMAKLYQIRSILDNFQEQILSLRVGSEDILSLINIRRESSMMIYDYIPYAAILSNIINIFRPHGYTISAPVFNSFEEIETFEAELARDVSLGMINKTIINPKQITRVHNAYRVSPDDLNIARELMATDKAILSFNGAMYERSTHLNWAKMIIKRGENYGTKL